MKLKFIFSTLLLITLLSQVQTGHSSLQLSQSPSLTIYTYDTLLADPGYAFDRAFEAYAGLDNGSVKVVYLSDAGSILTRSVAEKANPIADVVIGLDNILVHQARAQDILEAYQPENSNKLIDGLSDGLASDYLLTPYDYGIIALWYLNNEFTGDLDPESFDINQMTSQNFQEQLIVQDPRLSSPGLGFLLSTVALFGDDNEGLIDGSWQNFWRELSLKTAMTSSWTDALTRLYAEEERTMMVSYASSPAYGNCLFEDTTTSAILPSVDGQIYGWQQIEGIGLVKNSPHPDLAKLFIDWFISEELQNQIHLNQWVYPALQNIETPECYETSIDPLSISPLNDLLSPDTIKNNLDIWLDEWELAWIEGPTDGSNNFLPIPWSFVIILALIPIIRHNKE